jgi:hypothetical protein
MLTPATVPSAAANLSPATASLRGLDEVNFFLAGALAGFGPYVAGGGHHLRHHPMAPEGSPLIRFA